MPGELVENNPTIGLLTLPRESFFEDPRFKTNRINEYGGNSLLNRGLIDVFTHHPRTGKIWDITQFIDGISISEDYQTPFVAIELSVVNTSTALQFVQPGMWVSLHGPYFPSDSYEIEAGTGNLSHPNRSQYTEIARGQIVSINAAIGDDERIAVHVKDPAWLLAKNRIPYRLPEGTLTERLRFMEVRGFLRLEDRLIDTEHILPATRGGQESLWEDIMFDLGETNRVLGRKYVVRHHRGRFSIVDTERQVHMWSFEIGSNVMSATKQASIENFYNLIYVIGQEDFGLEEFGIEPAGVLLPVTGFAVDNSTITYMGQHILTVAEQLTTSTPDAQSQADELLKEYGKVEEVFTLSTYSIPGLRWGDKVLVYEPTLDIAGIFHVMSIQHQILNGSAMMTLTVQYDSVAPEEVRRVALEDIASFMGVDLEGLELSPEDFE